MSAEPEPIPVPAASALAGATGAPPITERLGAEARPSHTHHRLKETP